MTWLVIAALVIPLGLDLYMPVPERNPLTIEKIELGRRLFSDTRLSRDRSLSCSSCHDPRLAFSDGRVVPLGVGGRAGRRNAPALINRGYGRAFFWDGRRASLEEQVLDPIQDPNEMDLPLTEASTRVGLDAKRLGDALASYVRSIVSGASAYDQFVNGDRAALSAEEQAGLQIFRGKGHCTACHAGPNFSDEQFHDTGIAWTAASLSGSPQTVLDDGRFAVSRRAEDQGAFKTPTLREVAHTAPYMHDGSLPTLDAVVDFYDQGGRPNPQLDPELHPQHLSPADKQALVAFLRTLSGSVSEGPSILTRH